MGIQAFAFVIDSPYISRFCYLNHGAIRKDEHCRARIAHLSTVSNRRPPPHKHQLKKGTRYSAMEGNA